MADQINIEIIEVNPINFKIIDDTPIQITIAGETGVSGHEVELRQGTTNIQWRYVGQIDWNDLIAVADLIGPSGPEGEQGLPGVDGTDGQNGAQGIQGVPGANGSDGEDGREIQLQSNGTYIQWRYVGDASWTDLIALASLQGEPGQQGPKGDTGPTGLTGATGPIGLTGADSTVPGPQGPTGATGPQGIQGETGQDGADGAQGEPGLPGEQGADGENGVGVPTGGTTGQILAKNSNADFDTEWTDNASSVTASNGLTKTGDDIQLGGTLEAGGTAYITDVANGLEFSLIGSSDGVTQDASAQMGVSDADQAAILEMQIAYAQISHANYPSGHSATVMTSGNNIAITSIDSSTTNIVNVDPNGIALNGVLVDTEDIINNTEAVRFNLTPSIAPEEGQLSWNSAEGVLDMGTAFDGVTVQLGMENIVRVMNNTGSTILNGQVVYVNGALGNRPTVELADADLAPTALSVLGVATADFDDNTDGAITTEGIVRGLDTSAYTEGDTLYLSGTPGGLTTTEPTPPQTTVKVAVVTRSDITQGEILVRPYVDARAADYNKIIALAMVL